MNFVQIASFCMAMTCCFPIKVNSKRPYDIPGYTPMVPKLISLQHRAESNIVKPEKITAEKINSKILEEDINIYAVYHIDNEVGKSNNHDDLTNPPKN